MPHYRVGVSSVQTLTPRMVRVVVASDELREYEAHDDPDEYCRIYFPVDGRPAEALLDDDGEELSAEDLLDAPMRMYTIRRIDRAAGEITLDFVLHDGGIAADWVRAAKPGDELVLSDAHGGYEPSAGIRWQHLVADATGLPALGRIVEQARPGARIHATVIVHDESEQQRIDSAAEVTWRWVHEPDPNRIAEAIEREVRAFERPEGDGYVWVAGENSGVRRSRAFLRHELGLGFEHHHTLGYWRTDQEGWIVRYRAQRARIDADVEAAIEHIDDTEQLIDAIDAIYTDAGLG